MLHSHDEIHTRFADPNPLSEQEIQDALIWVTSMYAGEMHRLQIESTRHNTVAINEFNRSSATLTRWMKGLVGLQIVVAITQVAIVIFKK
jgi:hypothetical protein